MKSRRGFLAAIIFLSAIPVAVLCRTIFGIEADLILHFACAAGFAFISFAVFDFKVPKWINWSGCAATGALAFIFLLQGASQLIRSDSLTYFVFQILGQRVEAGLVKLLFLWFIALLIFDSRGNSRFFGLVVMSVVFCAEIYGFYLAYGGASLDETNAALKLLYLLPFAWLIFESGKKNQAVSAER